MLLVLVNKHRKFISEISKQKSYILYLNTSNEQLNPKVGILNFK
jgi:hypothetical protein